MEPERFDDVAYRIVEEPEPPKRPPRRRRWLLIPVTCVLMTGALAGGASALGGAGDDAARTVAPAKPAETSTKGWSKVYGADGHGCRRDEARRREASQVRY